MAEDRGSHISVDFHGPDVEAVRVYRKDDGDIQFLTVSFGKGKQNVTFYFDNEVALAAWFADIRRESDKALVKDQHKADVTVAADDYGYAEYPVPLP